MEYSWKTYTNDYNYCRERDIYIYIETEREEGETENKLQRMRSVDKHGKGPAAS